MKRRQAAVLVWHESAAEYRRQIARLLPVTHIEIRGPGGDAAPLPEIRVLLAWRLPEGALRSLPQLEWVQATGAGVDHLLERADLRPEVLLTRSLGRFGAQVAEYVVGHLLERLLDIEGYRRQQQRRHWQRQPRPLLADSTVGIVGLGSLGRAVAARVSAFGARVLGARRLSGDVPHVERVYSQENWRQMLPLCDVLVLAVPKTAATTGMVNAEAIASLRPGAVLVNVARGGLVEEDALVEALQSGQLSAAVLDVFRQEPLPQDHPLWDQAGARITPHIAAPSEIDSIASEFAANYRRFVNGDPLRNVVDRERGY
ncbi:MAG: D-2-hydroxyacid dehydrogenase [Acidobacteriota bacterium]